MGILQIEEQPPLIQAIFSGDFEEVNKCLLECKLDVNCLDCEKRTPLHAASFKGDALVVSLLLAHGARVNAKDSKWLTPLHRACCTKSEETVSMLLRYQADICARDKLWQTPLHVAAANDAYACVARLLNNVPNPNVTDRAGRTALHHAAFSGHTYVAQLLISKGCIVNACDKKDCRPIHFAAHMGYIDTIELLLQYGADINAKDRNQYTPLHAAAASGMENVCHLLLNAGAEVNAQNAYGNTPLHVACLNGHVTICQELLLYKGNVEAINYRGQTPLHIAAASTHGFDCLLYLLEQEVNINKQSLDGRTPLHMTAIIGRFTRSKTLIDKGAAVDCTDKNGCTPLHIAAQYGHDLLANTLLMYGADPKRKGYEGRSALHMCCLSGHVECCRKFIQAGVDLNNQDYSGMTATHCAAYKGSVECLDLLVSSGANFQIVDKIGRIALHYAAAQGHFPCVFTLVSIGSSVNASDLQGCTALHLAAAYDMDEKCVEYLIQHKADPKLRDKNGFTPLHYAVCRGNVTAVVHLLTETAKNEPTTTNNTQSMTTPLHLAAKNGNVDILRLILPYFPETNVKAANGVTPLMLAAREGHPNCVQMLLRFGAKVAIVDDLYNMTAIHYSAKNGYVHCLALLLDNTEDKKVVNFIDKFKRTALMLAVSGNHNECVLNLLKSGADPNICDNDMHSSLFRAVVAGQNNVVQLLLNKNAAVSDVDVHGKTVLHLAAACGHFSCLQSLLHHMPKEVATVLDKQQCTALHWACYNGSPACVEYLLQKGFFKITDGNPFSPVHCAVYSGSEKCLELLCAHQGAEIIHLTDSRGRTPLHVASLHGHAECVKFLLEKGADTGIQDGDGRTAFITAAQYGQSQIIELLLGYNANSSSYDKNGNTPLHWACLKRHSHTALLLLEYVTSPDLVNMINNDRKTPLHIAARNGLVQVTNDLIQKGANVMAVDAEGLTPALCCAPNKNVAQCLSIILHSYTNNMQGENSCPIPPVPVLTVQKIQKPCVKVKRMKAQVAQTEMTLLHDPDLFECQRLFNLKVPSTSVPSKFKVTRTKADKLPKGEGLKQKRKQGCHADYQERNRNDLEDKSDGYGLTLHKSHSDMYIPFKSSLEDLTKMKHNGGGGKKDFFGTPTSYCMVESTRTCVDCLQLNKKCSDCTIKKLFKQQSQGKINKQEFQYLLMKTCCDGTVEQPSYVSKVLDDLTKTYIKNFSDEDDDLKQRLLKKRTEGVSSVQCVKKPSVKAVPGRTDQKQSKETPIDKLYQQMLNPITKKVLEEVAKKNTLQKKNSKQNNPKSHGDKTNTSKVTGEDKKVEIPIVLDPDEKQPPTKKDLNIIISNDSEVDRKNDDEDNIEELFCKSITEIAQAKRAELRSERLKIIESVSDEDVLHLDKVTEQAEHQQKKQKKDAPITTNETVGDSPKDQIKVIHSNLQLIKDTNYLDEVVNYVHGIVKNLNPEPNTNAFKIVDETSPKKDTERVGDGEKLSTYHTMVCDISRSTARKLVCDDDPSMSKMSNSINTDISGEISNPPKKVTLSEHHLEPIHLKEPNLGDAFEKFPQVFSESGLNSDSFVLSTETKSTINAVESESFVDRIDPDQTITDGTIEEIFKTVEKHSLSGKISLVSYQTVKEDTLWQNIEEPDKNLPEIDEDSESTESTSDKKLSVDSLNELVVEKYHPRKSKLSLKRKKSNKNNICTIS